MRFARLPSSAAGNVTVPFMWNMEPKAQSCLMFKVTFWINGLMYKFVPCFLLTVFIGLLLRLMKGLNERRRALAQLMHRHKMPKDNTTPMLVAVLGIFLITELPQGLLSIGTGVFSSDEFHQRIYLPLGNLMDLLSILNSSVNFVIYCTMSTKFRAEFRKAICIRAIEKTYRRLHPKVGAAMRPRAGSQELFELLECKKPAALIKLLNSVSSPRDGTALLPGACGAMALPRMSMMVVSPDDNTSSTSARLRDATQVTSMTNEAPESIAWNTTINKVVDEDNAAVTPEPTVPSAATGSDSAHDVVVKSSQRLSLSADFTRLRASQAECHSDGETEMLLKFRHSVGGEDEEATRHDSTNHDANRHDVHTYGATNFDVNSCDLTSQDGTNCDANGHIVINQPAANSDLYNTAAAAKSTLTDTGTHPQICPYMVTRDSTQNCQKDVEDQEYSAGASFVMNNCQYETAVTI